MQMSVMEYAKKRRLIKASDAIMEKKLLTPPCSFAGRHPSVLQKHKKEFSFSPSLLKAMMMRIENSGDNSMSHVFMKATDFHASNSHSPGKPSSQMPMRS